jgi:predicted metal-dependent hydrolase
VASKQINLPNIGTVTLYKRRGNRSLRLTIGANGEVRVSLPYWLPYKAGEQFASSKSEWIAKNLVGSNIMLHNGQAIGKAHQLYFTPNTNASKVITRVDTNEVNIRYPSYHNISDSVVQEAAQKASIRALQKEAEALLPMRLATISQQTGHQYSSVGVKRLKSRWGSCSADREITLNLFLMQLPWSLIDYVLIHELVHTEVMQHGTPFWKKMETYLPNAKQLKKQMAEYKPRLMPIDRDVA